MSLSIRLGNLLYQRAFFLYRPLYAAFKRRQDRFEIALLKQHLRPGDTVLDIGANIGFYAQLLSQLTAPNGQVHCFEPDALNYQHLKHAVEGLGNLHIYQKAVGPQTTTLKIYTSKELNVDHRTYRPEVYEQELEVEAVSIDDCFGGQKVDFIKMDIQGFEMQAIQGMQQVLAANSQVKILSELWPYGLRTAGSSVSSYLSFLTDRGFNCYLMVGRDLQLLDTVKASQLEGEPKENYYNIFCTRGYV